MHSPAGGRERPPNVEELIRAARAGSADALGHVLHACRNYLLLVAAERLEPALRGKIGPSDVVQQTFLDAHRDFERFHGTTEEELLAWLRRILLNTLANMTRGFYTDKRQAGREVSLGDPAAVALGEQLLAETPSPASGLIAREESRQLHEAIERLPDDYREVIHLRHRDGLSFTAIGQVLGRSPEAARKLWGRAVVTLEHILEPPHESQ